MLRRFVKICRLCRREVPKGEEGKHHHEPIDGPVRASKPLLISTIQPIKVDSMEAGK